MRNIFFFVSLILFPVHLLLAQCGSVPEAKVVSLYSPGKSLSQHKLQDQDGLGTCYANAVSTVLTSALPGHPEVSYLHAAIANSSNAYDENGNPVRVDYVSGEKDFTYGGSFCGAVSEVTANGGACPQKFSILENKQLSDPNQQAALLKSVGKYFDLLNESSVRPEELAKFRKDLKSTFDLITLETDKIKASCLELRQKTYPLKTAYRDLISPFVKRYQKENNLCGKARLARLKVLSPGPLDGIALEPSDAFQAQFEAALESDPEMSKAVNDYFTKKSKDVSEAKKFLLHLNKFLATTVGADSRTSPCTNGTSYHYLLGTDPVATATKFLQSMKTDKQSDCQNDLLNDGLKDSLLSANAQKACLDPARLSEILETIIPLVQVGVAFNKDLYEKLTNTRFAHAQQLAKALMPGCLDPKNLVSMKGLDCSTQSLCADGAGADDLKPSKGCYEFPAAKALARKKFIAQIDRGRSLGVGVCTAFLTGSKIRTNFCTSEQPGVVGHGRHELAVSGYRCQGGKLEYEIVNSWGNRCPDDGKAQDNYTCQVGPDGKHNGRMWIKEDVLIDSTFQFSTLEGR